MFKLSKQVDYGLQLLKRLSLLEQGQVLSLRAFSEESTISFLFLQRIARALKGAGIVVATQGPKGGYVLARPYTAISLHDVVEAIEGDAIAPCLAGTFCKKESSCTIKQGIARVQKQITHVLKETSIATLSL